MNDLQPSDYDNLQTRNAEDEFDERERKRERNEARAEKAEREDRENGEMKWRHNGETHN